MRKKRLKILIIIVCVCANKSFTYLIHTVLYLKLEQANLNQYFLSVLVINETILRRDWQRLAVPQEATVGERGILT